jgi:hypothetical protein
VLEQVRAGFPVEAVAVHRDPNMLAQYA